MSEKTVFISYRRDATGKLFARSIKEALTHHGYDVFLDVDCLDAGKWAAQILTEVPKRAHFLLLLTPGALDRCTREDDWVRREFLAAVEHGRNIVPVREESVDLSELGRCCPECVKALFDYQIATIQHSGFARDIAILIERYIPPHKAPSITATPSASVTGFHADISRIIKYAPAELIGREDETKLLSDAWGQAVRGEKKRPHVLTFVALGGEGKTSLVAKWAADLAHQDWPGCDAVFAWSFYSQGTREMAASSDLFLKEALTFFGDAAMAGSAQGAFDKGRRLAQLVGERRALLILDGLEPLQYAPTSPTAGDIKDAGIAALLKGLAATSHGLCIVTTRYSVPDLKAFWQTTAPETKLPRLSKEAGVALLRSLGVKGTPQEFETLVEDVKGHALTLNLLGSYLHDAHGGDIRKRDLVKLKEADAEEQGGHAFRVMDAYVRWFESDGEKGRRALAVLQLLGLFDRAATEDCLAALQKTPAVPGLTEVLFGMSETQRNVVFTRLEAAKLLTVNRDPAGPLVSLDAHPLVREYFAQKLRTQHAEAWRAAHRRLYEHLCATTPDKPRPTLEDLQPLYQAVAHGCQAEMQDETLKKVYMARILKGTRPDEFYSSKKLGAFGADLGAIACFFERPWSSISPSLNVAEQAWLLNDAAMHLGALGRLTEALEPMRAALEMAIQDEQWKHAAAGADNLSELELTLGDVAAAMQHAEQAMTYADRSGDAFQRLSTRTSLADAQHQAGRRSESEVRFREAEAVHAKNQPQYPLLYSLYGFRYCDFFLAAPERAVWQMLSERGDKPGHDALDSATDNSEASKALSPLSAARALKSCRAIAQRAAQTLQWVEQFNRDLLSIALDHVTMGRTALYSSVLGPSNVQLSTPTSHLRAAVDGLRSAGAQNYIPRGLLNRAWLRFLSGAHTGPESAQSDLDEAWEIAERGPMKLFMADIHLYRARLFHAVKPYPWTTDADGHARGPQEDLAAARKLIEQCGYWRRKEELEDAEAAAKNW